MLGLRLQRGKMLLPVADCRGRLERMERCAVGRSDLHAIAHTPCATHTIRPPWSAGDAAPQPSRSSVRPARVRPPLLLRQFRQASEPVDPLEPLRLAQCQAPGLKTVVVSSPRSTTSTAGSKGAATTRRRSGRCLTCAASIRPNIPHFLGSGPRPRPDVVDHSIQQQPAATFHCKLRRRRRAGSGAPRRSPTIRADEELGTPRVERRGRRDVVHLLVEHGVDVARRRRIQREACHDRTPWAHPTSSFAWFREQGAALGRLRPARPPTASMPRGRHRPRRRRLLITGRSAAAAGRTTSAGNFQAAWSPWLRRRRSRAGAATGEAPPGTGPRNAPRHSSLRCRRWFEPPVRRRTAGIGAGDARGPETLLMRCAPLPRRPGDGAEYGRYAGSTSPAHHATWTPVRTPDTACDFLHRRIHQLDRVRGSCQADASLLVSHRQMRDRLLTTAAKWAHFILARSCIGSSRTSRSRAATRRGDTVKTVAVPARRAGARRADRGSSPLSQRSHPRAAAWPRTGRKLSHARTRGVYPRSPSNQGRQQIERSRTRQSSNGGCGAGKQRALRTTRPQLRQGRLESLVPATGTVPSADAFTSASTSRCLRARAPRGRSTWPPRAREGWTATGGGIWRSDNALASARSTVRSSPMIF